MQDRISQKNNFLGGIDTDTALTGVAENDYLTALNIRTGISESQEFQIVTNVLGNSIAAVFQLPDGYNKTCGKFEDKYENTLFYFNYNSNGDNQILRYRPQTKAIELVLQDTGNIFAWTLETNITHIDFVEDKLLYWVDPLARKINVNKSTNNKQRQYKLIQTRFTDPNPLNQFYTLTIRDAAGNILASFNQIIGTDYQTIAAFINALFNAGTQGDFLVAEAIGNDYVLVTFKQVNGFTLTYINTNAQDWAIAIPNNFYPATTFRIIYRGKYPYPLPPGIELINDPNKGYNLIKEKHFQFMLRLIMDDNEQTVYSPISDITITDCATNNYNGIRVTFTNDDFDNINVLSIIQRVELVVREGNIGKFKRIKTLEQWQIWDNSLEIGIQYYDFYNDGNYETIDDIEALRPYDAVGREIGCQTFADNRLFDSDFLENYDKPSPDVTMTAEFNELSKVKLFNIFGLVKIWSDDYYGVGVGGKDNFIYNLGDVDDLPTSDVWGGTNSGEVRTNAGDFGQEFALGQGGYVVYVANNSNYFTITEQNRTHGLPVTSTSALSAGTTEERDQIIQYITNTPDLAGRRFWSDWTLRALPAGSYTIRVASPWCSFGDLMDKGSMYDLAGVGFVRTSCPIKTFTDQAGVDLGQWIYEIRVEIDLDGTYRIYSSQSALPHATGTAGADNSIYAGEIIVSDNISVRDNSEKRWCTDGYLIDGGGSSDNKVLADNGVFMERQKVTKRELANTGTATIENIVSLITDHNGYFYFRLDGTNGGDETTVEFKAESIDGLLIKDWQEVFYVTSTSEFFLELIGRNGTILRGLYEETMDLIAAGTTPVGATHAPSVGENSLDASYVQVMLFNFNSEVTKKNRVRIKGRVQDPNGVGLENLSVLYERNGRQELTGADGSFELIAYGDFTSVPNSQRVIDAIIINNPNDCEIRFSYDAVVEGLFYLNKPQIISFGGLPYGDSETVPPGGIDYDLGNITGELLNSGGNRYLKSGGNYIPTLLYTDEMLRRCDLVLMDKIYVPFVTENRQRIQGITNTMTSGAANGFFDFTLHFGSIPPPSWAKYVYILRTLDATYNSFLQFPTFDIKYVVNYDGTDVVETTFETSTATEIWLNLTEALAKYALKNPDSTLGYTFAVGDRVRFISDALGNLFTIDGQPGIVDMKIKGEQALGDSVYLVIDNQDTFPKIEGGTLIEVYSPKLVIEEQQFFEIHTAVKIINGAYEVSSVLLDTGDTYRLTRIVPVEKGVAVNLIESSSISDFYISEMQDIGRISFSNPDFKEILRTNSIRFSNKFFEDTKVNGLSSFELLNVTQIPKVYGNINATRLTNDDNYRAVILLICENNVASAYIGEVILSDLAGSDVISLSNKVIPAIRLMKGDYGTTNPESVCFRDGKVWWWDLNRNKFVQYALNGITPITDYKFISYCKSINPDVVEGEYDVYHHEVIWTHFNRQTATLPGGVDIGFTFILSVPDPTAFSVGQTITIDGEDRIITNIAGSIITFDNSVLTTNRPNFNITYNQATVAYDDINNRWRTFYSYLPEKLAVVDDRFFSMKNGQLWIHDSNQTFNNFYNIQYLSSVTMVFNQSPFMIKLWFQLRVQANSKWAAPNDTDITLLTNASYPTGMASRLKKDSFQLKEGQFWAAFLRDINTPQFTNALEALLKGRNLRGEVLKLRIENDSTSLATLRQVETFAYPSMLTES